MTKKITLPERAQRLLEHRNETGRDYHVVRFILWDGSPDDETVTDYCIVMGKTKLIGYGTVRASGTIVRAGEIDFDPEHIVGIAFEPIQSPAHPNWN